MSNSVTILGGGHQGLAMAAHLSLNNVECYLWNRTLGNIQSIIDRKEIDCQGVMNGTAVIKQVSTSIKDVLQKTIMVTTPSNAHRDIAKLLAPYVDETYIIVLNPGRTFGVSDFISALKKYGCKSIPVVAETQTIIYTCRRIDDKSVMIYALKKDILISATNYSDTKKVLKSLPECIRKYFIPAKSYLETSFSNVGMVLHCAPVLMNIGWIENSKVDFKYYYEGISYSVANFLSKIDEERVQVAKGLGCEVETLVEWLHRTYNTVGNNLYEHLQSNVYYKEIDAPLSLNHRYIEEDVPNGLVPLESAGRACGIETPYTTLIINLANSVMEKDYRRIGRQYSEIM